MTDRINEQPTVYGVQRKTLNPSHIKNKFRIPQILSPKPLRTHNEYIIFGLQFIVSDLGSLNTREAAYSIYYCMVVSGFTTLVVGRVGGGEG